MDCYLHMEEKSRPEVPEVEGLETCFHYYEVQLGQKRKNMEEDDQIQWTADSEGHSMAIGEMKNTNMF